MPAPKTIALVVASALCTWIASSAIANVHAQAAVGSMVRIVGVGENRSLPADADGNAYLPVRTETDVRQLAFDSQQWQQHGEVMSLMDGNVIPKEVTICAHRLSLIQESLQMSQTDESSYFPITVSGTGLAAPEEGCFSITPAAYLPIKGITTMTRAQLPKLVVAARY